MAWKAKHPGTCSRDCGVRIREGDLIDWEVQGFPHLGYHHFHVCPDQPDPLAADHPPCPVCHLVHPPGTCDR